MLPLADVLSAEDIDELLRAEQLTGSSAQRIRAVTSIHSYRILAVVTDVPPLELPAAGVLHQPATLGSTGLILLRRWLWRRALLTADELGGTGLHPDELNLRATSPEAAARALLGTLPGGAPPTPQRHDVDLGSAWSRLHLLGVLSLRPRDLRTSLPVPDTELTPTSGRIGRPLVPSAAAERLDNLLFHPRLGGLDGTRRVLQDVDDDAVLASHALDRRAVGLLLADRTGEALAHRGRLMLDAISLHWARMAEFGARDATPVAALFDDGGDDGAP